MARSKSNSCYGQGCNFPTSFSSIGRCIHECVYSSCVSFMYFLLRFASAAFKVWIRESIYAPGTHQVCFLLSLLLSLSLFLFLSLSVISACVASSLPVRIHWLSESSWEGLLVELEVQRMLQGHKRHEVKVGSGIGQQSNKPSKEEEDNQSNNKLQKPALQLLNKTRWQ